jgi:hypothetical protein
VSHRFLNLKYIKNLKLAKQKSLSRWQLINFGWLILNFKSGEKSVINYCQSFYNDLPNLLTFHLSNFLSWNSDWWTWYI